VKNLVRIVGTATATEIASLMLKGCSNTQIQNYLLEKNLKVSRVTLWKFRKKFVQPFVNKESEMMFKMGTLGETDIVFNRAVKLIGARVQALYEKSEAGVELSYRELNWLLKALKVIFKIKNTFEREWNLEKDLWEYEKLRERYVKREGN
jgi:hypothetical protein